MIFPKVDASATDPKPTALFSATASVSHANSWTSINGWAVPLVYSTTGEEYEIASKEAGVADFGALCRYIVRGRQAPDFLSRITTAPVQNLEIGESARGLILTSGGAVVDSIEVSRLGGDMYLLTCSGPHARRLQLAGRGLETTIEDITGRVAALAIVGPKARDIAASAGVDVAGENLASQLTVRGIEAASRPIFVGAKPGVEIIYPYEEALTLWERVRRAAAPGAIGLDTLDILRIESGTPRPGVDFVNADVASSPDRAKTPQEIGLPHLAPLNRAWFNGRRSLVSGQTRPSAALNVIAIDSENVDEGAIISSRGAPVGKITSAAFSPRMRRIVAFAEISLAAAQSDLEVATQDAETGAASAKILETPESAVAEAFLASLSAEATESRRWRV